MTRASSLSLSVVVNSVFDTFRYHSLKKGEFPIFFSLIFLLYEAFASSFFLCFFPLFRNKLTNLVVVHGSVLGFTSFLLGM